MGFSDTTIQHVAFLNAGVVLFYGPSMLTDLAENGGIHPYTEDAIRRSLFSSEPFGTLAPAQEWTEHFLDWNNPQNQAVRRTFEPNSGWDWIQGGDQDPVDGRLMGGCMEVLEMLKGTPWWPQPLSWKGAVLYFETSEVAPELWLVEEWLRNYVSQGIVQNASAILFGRPMGYTLEKRLQLRSTVAKVLAEAGHSEMPVVMNMDFGHTSPMSVLPNGCRLQVDGSRRQLTLLESGVQ